MAPMKRPAIAGDPVLHETLPIAVAARRLKISAPAVRRLIVDGRLDFVEYRGAIRVALADVQRLEQTT